MTETQEASLPLVTVIIPCYNHAGYVARAVSSVLEQDYPAIQLVVIDDGSVDDSVGVVEAIARDSAFAVVRQENRGICRTLNRAIREFAQGEWIALLASDDFWRRDKVRLQIEALQGNAGSRFCFSQAREFRDETTADQGRIFPRTVRHGHVLDHVFVRQHVPAGTMMFARSLFEELGGFDEALREEDWDFVIRSAAVTPFTAVSEPLLYYRAHDGNTMRTAGRRRIFQQKAIILAKNMHLVSVWRWLLALGCHFAHDIGWTAIRRGG
jgi:alpha-1,3-rhamnosyltransferase